MNPDISTKQKQLHRLKELLYLPTIDLNWSTYIISEAVIAVLLMSSYLGSRATS